MDVPKALNLHRFRVFTLDEANRVVAEVESLTRATRDRLVALRQQVGDQDEAVTQQTRALIDAWAREILEIGAQPKGIFTVDFRSPDPNVLWCWTPGEDHITHRHFTWEGFKDRVRLDGRQYWPSRN